MSTLKKYFYFQHYSFVKRFLTDWTQVTAYTFVLLSIIAINVINHFQLSDRDRICQKYGRSGRVL